MRKILKRLSAIMLSLAMVITLMPQMALAKEYGEIQSISFTPIEPFEYLENFGGSWEVDEDDGEEFYYYDADFRNGDILTVNYSDKSVAYTYDEDEYSFISSSGDEINREDVCMEPNQYTTHWKLGSNNYVRVAYYPEGYDSYSVQSNRITVTIKDNPISNIKYIKKTPVVYIYESKTNGEWDYDEDDNRYFYYDTPWYEQGDIIRITNKDSSFVDYVYDDDDEVFRAANGDIIDEDDVDIETNQYENHWDKGNNKYVITVYGYETVLYAQVIDNPVKSATFIRDDLSYFENAGGKWEVDEDTGEKFYYYYGTYFQEGDSIKVTYTDPEKGTVIYNYNYKNDTFVSKDGEILPEEQIDIDNDQYENHWKVGRNQYTASVYGYETKLYATVTENPVKAISYTPAKEKEYYENSKYHGYWTEDEDGNEFFRYYTPNYKEGDVLTLTYKENNRKVTYTCEFDDDEEEYLFVSESGERLSADDKYMGFDDNQWEEHWKVGKNKYTFTCYGYEVTLYATVIKSQVKSIKYNPAEQYEVMENDENEGSWEEYNGERFFWYYIPWFSEGDKLTVNYINGTTTTYTYDVYKEQFVAANGNTIDEDDVDVSSDQYNDHWTVGENYYEVAYQGKVDQVSVIVKENNVKAISFVLNKHISVYDTDYYELEDHGKQYKWYNYYNYEFFSEGDTLKVTFNDGSTKKYTYTYDDSEDDYYFVNGKEKIDPDDLYYSDNQNEEEWTIGETNYINASYCGKKAQLPVDIVINTIRSMIFNPKNEIHVKENTNGEWDDDEYGNKYYYYWIQLLNDGDTLTVNYGDGSQIEYTFDYNNYQFVSGDGSIIKSPDLVVSNMQWAYHWLPNQENIFTMYYHGVRTNGRVYIDSDEEETTTPTPTTTPEQTTTVAPTTTKKEVVTTTEQTTTKSETTTASGETTAKQPETKKEDTTTKPLPKNYKKVSVKKLKSRKKSLKVTWKKVKGVKGYQIQASLKKKFKKCKTVWVPNAKKKSAVIKKLKAKKKYFVRMRTYIEVGGIKVFSPWSKPKKKKTK